MNEFGCDSGCRGDGCACPCHSVAVITGTSTGRVSAAGVHPMKTEVTDQGLNWTVTLLTETLPCERCAIYLEWEADKYQPTDTDFRNLPKHTGPDHIARRTTYMSGFPAPNPDPARVNHTLRVVHNTLATVVFVGKPLEIFEQIGDQKVVISTVTALKLGREMERVWAKR